MKEITKTEMRHWYPDFELPDSFLTEHVTRPDSYYLASCTEDACVFIDKSFKSVTGHAHAKFANQGINWWFSIIHPQDANHVIHTIFTHCFLLPVSKRLNQPFSLEYRIRNEDSWRWIHETKCVVSVTAEGKNNFVVGRLVDITDIKRQHEDKLDKLMEEQGRVNPLLRAANPILQSGKIRFDSSSAFGGSVQPDNISMPTKREKEILQLIGEGLSTKQIAGKLHISINTVETHRRHLLDKIKVKNSMELIKQTSNAAWLKAI